MSIKLSIVFLVTIFIGGLTILHADGTITGNIKFEGKSPTMKKIKMGADPICSAKHSDAPTAEWLLLGENGELMNVFVYIKEGVTGNFPTPSEPVVIDQNGCLYKPHVIGVQTGQSIDILNSDGTLHNIHAKPKINREFNKAQPKFKKKLTVSFDKVEIMVPLKCDVHPWMGAWIGVLDHPFFAVTGENGSFTISGLEAGTYTVEAWHERLGKQTATVTIKADESASTDFIFTPPKRKK